MLLHAIFLAIFIRCTACYSPQQLRELYREWKIQYRGSSSLLNDRYRFRLFQHSAKLIELINSRETEWRAGFTQFADMTAEEMSAYTGLNASLEESNDDFSYNTMPENVEFSDPEKKYWEMG